MTYTSDLRTEAARNEAAATVDRVFVVDEAVLSGLLAQENGYFVALSQAALTVAEDPDAALAAAREALPGDYSDPVLLTILTRSDEERAALQSTLESYLTSYYQEGVRAEEVEATRQSIAVAIGASTITGDDELFLKSLLEGLELPYNEAYDAAATAAAVETAMAAVEPVQITVQSGEKIISRGSEVTPEQVETLQALGLQSSGVSVYWIILGLFLLVALTLTLVFLYLRSYQREIYASPNRLLLLAVVLVSILFLAKLISLIGQDGSAATAQIGYLLPAAAASMLLTVLLNRDVAIVISATLALYIGVIMNGALSYAVVAFVSCLAAAISARRLSQRSQFVTSSLYIIIVNVVTIGAWGLVFSQSLHMIGIGMAFGAINGLMSAVLAMGMLPFLESGFGITTVIRLLELSNSNHPLLKRLMMEAPGTYNHSVLVGNLAEAAADAIGADSLLVRVGSYYHDIGKLKRPQFFVENQRPGDNPHDKLQPALSAMIITAHPGDGAKMLRELRFPVEIIDIVEQHHGTGLLSYFYLRAKENALDIEDVKEADFRYKGQRPQTKEAALVMLADSVQAAIQAMTTGDKQQMENRVREVIQGKIDDGQLRDCPLTFRDLNMIGQTFLMVLSGVNHHRISYPGQDVPQVEATHEFDASYQSQP